MFETCQPLQTDAPVLQDPVFDFVPIIFGNAVFLRKVLHILRNGLQVGGIDFFEHWQYLMPQLVALEDRFCVATVLAIRDSASLAPLLYLLPARIQQGTEQFKLAARYEAFG